MGERRVCTTIVRTLWLGPSVLAILTSRPQVTPDIMHGHNMLWAKVRIRFEEICTQIERPRTLSGSHDAPAEAASDAAALMSSLPERLRLLGLGAASVPSAASSARSVGATGGGTGKAALLASIISGAGTAELATIRAPPCSRRLLYRGACRHHHCKILLEDSLPLMPMLMDFVQSVLSFRR